MNIKDLALIAIVICNILTIYNLFKLDELNKELDKIFHERGENIIKMLIIMEQSEQEIKRLHKVIEELKNIDSTTKI